MRPHQKIKHYPDRKAWEEARQHSIGASESAALLGHGYSNQTPLSIWESKMYGSPEPSEELRKRFDRGHLMEEFAVRLYESETGVKVNRVLDSTYVHPDFDFITATPDGVVVSEAEEHGIECKFTEHQMLRQWARDGLPMQHIVQPQHQMMVTGWEMVHLVAVAGPSTDPLILPVYRNQVFIDALQAKLVEWWRNHIEGRRPPEPSEADNAVLHRLFGADDGTGVHLDPECDELLEEYEQLNDKLKFYTSRKGIVANAIKAKIGSATYGITPGGYIAKWAEVSRKGYTVEPSTSRQFRLVKKLPAGVQIIDGIF